MATDRLERNLDFLKLLTKVKPKQRQAIIKTSDRDLVLCLCECVLNLLEGNLKITPSQLEKLKRYKNPLRTLVDNKTSIKEKRNILEQRGGFLPILLAPILSIASQLLFDSLTKS